MEIRILSRRGMSIRAIARELRISRNTVRKYLRGEAVREVERRSPGRPRKLEPYEEWIRRRVEAAAPIRLPAIVLHREIKAMGYDGSERTVRRFMASLQPKAVPEPVVRFETPAGHQAQMDWGEYRLGRRKVYAFVGVLAYSRWLYLEELKSNLVYGLHDSGGYFHPADLSLIDSINKLHTGDDVSDLPMAA